MGFLDDVSAAKPPPPRDPDAVRRERDELLSRPEALREVVEWMRLLPQALQKAGAPAEPLRQLCQGINAPLGGLQYLTVFGDGWALNCYPAEVLVGRSGNFFIVQRGRKPKRVTAAAAALRLLPDNNHRYFFKADGTGPVCHIEGGWEEFTGRYLATVDTRAALLRMIERAAR